MPVPEGLKAAFWPSLLLVILTLAGFLAKDVMVSRYVTPRVIAQLKTERYLRPAIREGRFVATDLKEFSDNHIVPSSALTDLKNGDMVPREEFSREQGLLGQRIDTSTERVAVLEARLADLQAATAHLTRLLETERNGGFPVTLYISDLEADRGFLVLNSLNRLVAHFLTNEDKYRVSAGDKGSKTFRVRLEETPAPGQPEDAAIGRMYREDYHNLFSGVGSSIGKATVHVR